MKKLLFAAASLLLLLTACGPKDDPQPGPTPTVSITGVWELSSVEVKSASVGGVSVAVYVEFSADAKFSLYQKIGEGRYSHFAGTYTFTDNVLSGSYDSGAKWGPYTVSVTGTNLTLTSSSGKEVDNYKKISSIPSSVLTNIY